MAEDKSLSNLQLEIGGSYFELIEFSLNRQSQGKKIRGLYGVNVAKVREVVRMPKINPLSSQVPGIAGVFELRGVPIPAIHLAQALGDQATEVTEDQQIIVTEFSQKRAGFIVDSTHRIRRIAWDKVLPPSSDAQSCINGMTLVEKNEFLFILDLERILIKLEKASGFQPAYDPSQLPNVANADSGNSNSNSRRYSNTLLLIDDSGFIRGGVAASLGKLGFTVYEAGDGAEALQIFQEAMSGSSTYKPIDCIISDVEMPRMDGLSFTRQVREGSVAADIPIILHTSLSGRANQDAGAAVGANGYVIKNDLRGLVAMLDEVLPQRAA